MKRNCALAASVALIGLISFVPSAHADDFAPPPWRGGPNYTLQGWEFLSPGTPVQGGSYLFADDPAVAQHWGNGPVPFFTPVAGIGNSTPDPLATWTDGMTWDPGSDGDGGLSGPGAMAFWIPNWIDNEQLKWMRIQVTFQGPAPLVIGLQGGFGNDPNNTVSATPLSSFVFIDNNHYYQDWQIVPNPHWERFGFEFGSNTRLDELVIDTISFTIPEPGTVTLLVLGAVALTTRNRR